MSDVAVVPIISAPVLLPLVVAGATVAAAGAICYGIGKAMSARCKEVYKMCKEGKYPVERLQLVQTPIPNFPGLTKMLESQGFTLSSLGDTRFQHTPCVDHFENKASDMLTLSPKSDSLAVSNKQGIYPGGGLQNLNTRLQTFSTQSDPMVVLPNPDLDPFASIKQDIPAMAHSDMSVATNAKGERIFLVNSGGRIGLIADRIDLIQSTVQDFATQEIVSCLKSSDFRVTLEQKGDEKIISASDSKKNVVKVTVEKGKGTICFDTRKTRRPKCDFMHQLIKAKLVEKATSSPGIDSPQRKHRREDNQIRVKR